MPVSIKALAKTLADHRPKRFENDWKEFIKRPQHLAEECQNVIAEKANAEDLGELLAELQKEDAKELIERFYRKYEKAEDHPVDHVALVDRLRRLIQLTELSARLMHAQNATSFSPLLAELEQLFQPIVDPDDQIGWPDVDGGRSPLGAVDKWIRRGIQQTQDTDAKNQYASDRAILAFLHPHLRTVRQTLTFSGLYYYEEEDGAEKGCVVKLTAKAFGEGTGSIYPDPETMTLAPLAETKGEQFTEQVESAWDLAKKRTGKCSDLEIDIQWSVNLDDLPDESPKHRFKLSYPIAGNSWNASWTTVFECLLAGDDVDLGWALTAAVDECGKLKSVAGVAAKSEAWFEKGRELQEDYRLLVDKEDLKFAKQGAGQASSCVRQVGTLDDVKQELEELRRDLYGPVNFQRPPVPPDFTGREDAIERLTAILNSEESRYVVVGGERGMGKSALLAKMIEDAYNEGERPVFHVAGHDRVGLQESLVAKLKRKHQHDIRFHQKKSLSDVLDVVQEFLEREDRTEILYLDESNADDMLPVTQDLPRKLPSRFRCLIMTRDADRYEQHLPESEYAPHQLEELLDDGGRRDVREYLLRHAKDSLRADVIDAIGRHKKTVANFKTIKWCLKQLKNENKLSEHLRDSPDMWLRKPITSSIRPSVATDFLTELSDKGLCNNVQFLPEHIETGCDIEKFCLPPRVVDAEQWEQQRKRASELGRPGFHQRSEADDRYVMMSHEEFLRGDGEDRVVPHPLSAPNDDDWQVLEGEPGEGKTTALWLMIAQQCRELLACQQRGEPITEASGYRIPLALPLRTVDSEKQHSERLIELAREYVLSQMGSLETEKRGQLRQWLDQKIQDREYTLYLDAWDELPGGEAGRSWLKEQLLDCRDVAVLMTTRTSLSHEARGLTPEPRRYRMVCFGNRQIREYVEQFFKKQPEQGRELRERSRLSPGPSQLMQLPLLLGLMCMQKRKHPDEPLPQTRTELLQRGLYELFERGDKRRKIEDPRKERNWQKERVLRYVAWRFHKAEPVELSNSLRDREQNLDNVLKEKIEWLEEDPPKNAQALLTEFVEDGVLVPVGRDTYRFVLRSFHEYCLAGWIAQEKDSPLFRAKDEPTTLQGVLRGTGTDWERTDWDDFTPLVEENWQHVWPLVAGQMDDKSADSLINQLYAIVINNSALSVEPLLELLAKIVSECDPTLDACQEFVTYCCGKLEDESRIVINDTDVEIPMVSDEHESLEHPERDRSTLRPLGHYPFAQALTRCGHEKGIEKLIAVVNDEEVIEEIRIDIAQMLVRLESPKTLDALHAVIRESKRLRLREACLVLLAPTDSDQYLLDGHLPPELRKAAAFYGYDGSPESCKSWSMIARDESTDASIRKNAVVALGACGLMNPVLGGDETATNRAVDSLISLLKNDSVCEEIRAECGIELFQIDNSFPSVNIKTAIQDTYLHANASLKEMLLEYGKKWSDWFYEDDPNQTYWDV
ncbi:hypothetical protein N9F76_00655 [bacterium]|nr:hypothetical protein [bacterium]